MLNKSVFIVINYSCFMWYYSWLQTRMQYIYIMYTNVWQFMYVLLLYYYIHVLLTVIPVCNHYPF